MMRTCIGCGCDDEQACLGGCAWHFESKAHPHLGICTSCIWEIMGPDLEAVVAEVAEDWPVRADELAADRADASDLILPGHPEFDSTLRYQHR